MIEVDGLGKHFGRTVALDDVGFTVPEGEVFGLVGSNGSGKTTVLRILATLLRPDRGRATIAGISVAEAPDEVRALIGYLPDAAGTERGVTALEHLVYHGAVHRIRRSQRQRVATELLELVGLADRRHDEVSRFSRGQQQRLGLARALVHDPSVLLLDDALGLDPTGQLELRGLVAELRSMGKTIVVSSHHLSELEQVCTWVGLMEGGTMVACGPIDQVREPTSDGRRIAVELVDEGADATAAAATLVEALPGVTGHRVVGPRLEVTVDESFLQHELVAVLVTAGVKVRSVGPSAQRLDEAVLRLAGGGGG